MKIENAGQRKICPAFSAYVKIIRRWRKKKLLLPAAGDSNARNSGRDNQAFPDKNWFLKTRLRRRCGISVANGIDSIGNLGKSSVQRRKTFSQAEINPRSKTGAEISDNITQGKRKPCQLMKKEQFPARQEI